MLKASDFIVFNAQAIIFTSDYLAFSVPKFLSFILGKYAELYNGNVQTIPLPESAPAEFPRIILQSKDEVFRLEASPSRINFIGENNILSYNKSPKEVITTCTEVLKYYAQAPTVEINRLALVVTWVHNTESSAQLLVEKFCKPELQASIFHQAQNFEVHSYEKSTLEKFSTNVWIRCKATDLITENNSKKIIMIEQDINTSIEEINHIFTIEEISEYFDLALTELNRLLELYFPNSN